jgi:glycosyltransferase involved in cell wall biosynthesis
LRLNPGAQNGEAPMNDRLVSVIIPSFNCRKHVCAAIDSALAQSHSLLEVIVIDDGSTDGTGALISERYGSSVRYAFQANRGLAAARNAGLAMASGDLIQFLDSDDLLRPEKVAKHVDFLEKHPDTDVVYSDFVYFVSDPAVDSTPSPDHYRARYGAADTWTALLSGNFIVCHAALVRRSAILAVDGFDESLRACEDYDLWLRLAARGSGFRHAGAALALYRRTPGSMSSRPMQQWLENLRVLDKVPTYAVFRNDSELARWKAARSQLHARLAQLCVSHGENLQGWRHAALAIMQCPTRRFPLARKLFAELRAAGSVHANRING